MTGAQSASTSLLYAAGVTVTGTPTVPSSGLVSPMSLTLIDDALLGTGFMDGLQVVDNIYTGTGGRNAITGIANNLGGTAGAGQSGIVGVQGIGSGSTNVGGTSGTTVGTIYGGNFQVYCNGTYFNVCNPVEDDISVTQPVGNKFGHSIVMLATDTTNGTQSDTALAFLRQTGASTHWNDIFDLSGNGLNSAIGSNTTWLTSSSATSMTSLINAGNVTFSGNAITLPGFSVSNSGVASFTPATTNAQNYPLTASETTAGVTPTAYTYAENDIRRYGATGTGEDDTTAWNNAVAVGAINGRPVTLAGLSLNFSAGITYNFLAMQIQGQGAKLTFATLASGTCALTLDQSGYGSFTGIIYGFTGFQLVGPSSGGTTRGVCFGNSGASSTTGGAYAAIDRFSVQRFGYGLYFNSNTWNNIIGSGNISLNGTGIYYPVSLSNSGEGIWFSNVSVSNNTNGVVVLGGASLRFSLLALDYNTGRALDAEAGGKIYISQFHMESNYDSDYWMYETGSGSLISIDKGDITNSSSGKINYPIGYGPTSNGGGIFLGDVIINPVTESNYAFNYIIAGGGGQITNSAFNQLTSSGTQAAVSHSGLSLLSDGGFGNSNAYVVDPVSYSFQTNIATNSGTGRAQSSISTAQYFNGAHTGFIATLGSITGGSLYTNGSYGTVGTGVALTGGSGTGATAKIYISGGAVTNVVIVNPGVGYAVSDTLSAAAANIGGTGSGFSVPVATLGSINQSAFTDVQSLVQAPQPNNRGIDIFAMRLNPGAVVNFCGRLLSTSTSTADYAIALISFLDENGQTLSTNSSQRSWQLSTVTINTWNRFCFMPYGGAPAGTKFATVLISKQSSTQGISDGVGSIYWDDLYLQVTNGQGSLLSAGEWYPITNPTIVLSADALAIQKGIAIDAIRIVNTNATATSTPISLGTGGVLQTSGLGTVTTGSGYTASTTTPNVPLTGGTGSGAIATIVTGAGGGVSTVTITSGGNDYLNGDVLSASTIPGGGTGFSVPVTNVTNTGSNDVYASLNIPAGGEIYLPCAQLLKCYQPSVGRWNLYLTTPGSSHYNISLVTKRIITQGY